MNTIKVYVKQNNEYVPIEGNVVNLTVSELLDEQLDEARLIITNSLVENYPPTTEFAIEYLKDGVVIKSEFFISGEPKATQFVKPSA